MACGLGSFDKILKDIKLLKVDMNKYSDNLSEASEATSKKGQKWDTHNVTPRIAYDYFTKSKTDGKSAYKQIFDAMSQEDRNVYGTAINRLFNGHDNIVENSKLFDDLKVNEKGKTPEEIEEAKKAAGLRMQVRALVIHHITQAMKSESDVMDSLNIDRVDYESHLVSEHGTLKLGSLNMADALGRDINYLLGVKASGSKDITKAYYQQVGMQAIKELSEKKNSPIKMSEDADWTLNNKLMKSRSESLSPKPIIQKYRSVWVVPEHFVGKDKELQDRALELLYKGKSLEMDARFNDTRLDKAAAVYAVGKFGHRLSTPSNLEQTYHESSDVVYSKGINITSAEKAVLKSIQQSEGQVNPRIGRLFLRLGAAVKEKRDAALLNPEKNVYDFRSIVKKEFGDDAELLNFIFGTEDMRASEGNKNTAVGQAISKTQSVQDIIENVDHYFNEDGTPKKLFYSHEVYKNGRAGYLQTILNVQSDKFFSRFAVDGGEYTIRQGTQTFEHLIAGIMDESGYTNREAMFNEGVDLELDELIKHYELAYGKDGKSYNPKNEKRFFRAMKSGKYPKMGKGLWDSLHAIEGIKSLRDSDGKTVTTRFQTKPDATGSGIVLQFMQMLGHGTTHDQVVEMLTEMGIIDSAGNATKKAKDVYGFLEEGINEEIASLHEFNKDFDLDKIDISELEKAGDKDDIGIIAIQKLKSTGIFKNTRDVAKPTTMITAYLAGKLTVMKTTGKFYADEIFDLLEGKNGEVSVDQMKFIKELGLAADKRFGTNLSKDTNRPMEFANIKGMKANIESYLAETAGSKMVDLIGEKLTSRGMDKFHNEMQDMYKTMKDVLIRHEENLLKSDPLKSETKTMEAKILPGITGILWRQFEKASEEEKKGSKYDSFYKWKTVTTKDKKTGKESKRRVRDVEKTEFEVNQEFGMPILSKKEMLTEINGESVLTSIEAYNDISSVVNIIHSLDRATLHFAQQNARGILQRIADGETFKEYDVTPQEARLALKQLALSVHDSTNSNAILNMVQEREYQKATKFVSANYDMRYEMNRAIHVIGEAAEKQAEKMYDRETGEQMSNNVFDFESRQRDQKRSQAIDSGAKSKKDFIDGDNLDVSSKGRIFGFDYTKETETEPTPEPDTGGPKPTEESKPEPEVASEENLSLDEKVEKAKDAYKKITKEQSELSEKIWPYRKRSQELRSILDNIAASGKDATNKQQKIMDELSFSDKEKEEFERLLDEEDALEKKSRTANKEVRKLLKEQRKGSQDTTPKKITGKDLDDVNQFTGEGALAPGKGGKGREINPELQKIYDQQTKRINEILDNGEEYVVLDLENTFSTKDKDGNPIDYKSKDHGGSTEILEVHVEGRNGNDFKETKRYKPSDAETYDKTIDAAKDQTGKEYLKSESFKDEAEYSDHSASIQIYRILKQATKDFTTPILAYNGIKSDFVHIRDMLKRNVETQRKNPKSEFALAAAEKRLREFEKAELLDAQMYANNHLKDGIYKELEPEKAEYPKRNQELMAKRYGVKSKGKSHTAEVDVKEMDDIVRAMHKENKSGTKPEERKGATESEKHPNLGGSAKETERSVKEVNDVLETSNSIGMKFLRQVKGWKDKVKVGVEGVSKFDASKKIIEIAKRIPESFSTKEAVEHEVVHFMTHNYLATPEAKRTPQYKYLKRVTSALETHKDALKEELSPQAYERVEYILKQNGEHSKLSEASAILSAESRTTQDIVDGINKVIDRKTASGTLARQAANKIVNLAGKFFTSEKIDITELQRNLNTIIYQGAKHIESGKEVKGVKDAELSVTPERQAFLDALKHKEYEPIEDGAKIPFLDDVLPEINNYASSFIFNVLTTKESGLIEKGWENADKYMSQNFPIYKKNRDIMVDKWDKSAAIQRWKGSLNPERFGKREDMIDILGMSNKAEQDKTHEEDTSVKKINDMFEMIGSTKSKAEATKLQDAVFHVTTTSPIASLILSTNKKINFRKLVDGEISIDDAITELEKGVGPAHIKKAKRLAQILYGADNLVVNRQDPYNVIDFAGKGKHENLKQLVALYTMKLHPEAEAGLRELRNHQEFTQLVQDANAGLHQITNDMIFTDDVSRFRENLVNDQIDSNVEVNVITREELNQGLYNAENGWKILRQPGGREFGIAYRENPGGTSQKGATTTLTYRNTDLVVPSAKANSLGELPNNVLKTNIGKGQNRYKLVLTRKEKEQLGWKKNPGDSLYRQHSRMMEIKETQVVRDLLLTHEFVEKPTLEKDLSAYDKKLRSLKPEERKWMIKLPKDIEPSEIMTKTKRVVDANGKVTYEFKYPEISNYYTVPEKVTSVKGFKEGFDLVRIDMEPWFTGYKDMELFEKSPSGRKAAYAVRQIVKHVKIGWTALNPIKIKNDLLSNTTILLGKNVPALKIPKYSKVAFDDLVSLEKARMEIIDAKVNGDTAKAQRLEKEIRDHPAAHALYNGLLASNINLELFGRDKSVVSGLQHDMENILLKYIIEPGGKKSVVYDAIKAINEFGGVGLDSIAQYMADSSKNVEYLRQMGESLEKSANKWKDLRESDKAEAKAKLVTEFMGAPNSEAVQLGSFVQHQIDNVSKLVYFRHLLDTGMSVKDAKIEVVKSFDYYSQNVQKGVKFLSDYGVLLFPQFRARVQRVIWSIFKANPVNALSMAALAEVLAIDTHSVFEANAFNQLESGPIGMPPIYGFTE